MALMVSVSCEKNDQDPDDTGNGSITPVQSVAATIDGDPFNSITVVHQLLDDSMHVFIATSVLGDILTIRTDTLAVGTYDIDFDSPSITLFTGGYMYDQSPAPAGTITISENTGSRISGSFETSVSNIAETGQTITITSGSFTSLSY